MFLSFLVCGEAYAAVSPGEGSLPPPSSNIDFPLSQAFQGIYERLSAPVQKAWQVILPEGQGKEPLQMDNLILKFLQDLHEFGGSYCAESLTPEILLNLSQPTSNSYLHKMVCFMASPLGQPGQESQPLENFKFSMKEHRYQDTCIIVMEHYLRACLQALGLVSTVRQCLNSLKSGVDEIPGVLALQAEKKAFSSELTACYGHMTSTFSIFQGQIETLVTQGMSLGALRLGGRLLEASELLFYALLNQPEAYKVPDVTPKTVAPLSKIYEKMKHLLVYAEGDAADPGAMLTLPILCQQAADSRDSWDDEEYLQSQKFIIKILGRQMKERNAAAAAPQATVSSNVMTLKDFLVDGMGDHQNIKPLLAVEKTPPEPHVDGKVERGLQEIYRSLNGGRTCGEKPTKEMISYCAFAFSELKKQPPAHNIENLDDPLYTEGHVALLRFFPPSPYHSGGAAGVDVLFAQVEGDATDANTKIFRQTLLTILELNNQNDTVFFTFLEKLEDLLKNGIDAGTWSAAKACILKGDKISRDVLADFYRKQYAIEKMQEPDGYPDDEAVFKSIYFPSATNSGKDANATQAVVVVDAEAESSAINSNTPILLDVRQRESALNTGRKFLHRLFISDAKSGAEQFFQDRREDESASASGGGSVSINLDAYEHSAEEWMSCRESTDPNWTLALARAAILGRIRGEHAQRFQNVAFAKTIRQVQHLFSSAFQGVEPLSAGDPYYSENYRELLLLRRILKIQILMAGMLQKSLQLKK